MLAAAPLSATDGRLAVQLSGPKEAALQVSGPAGLAFQTAGPVALCGLPPGDYTIVASAAGFAKTTGAVNILPGQTAVARLAMENRGRLKVSGHSGTSLTVRASNDLPVANGALPPGVYRLESGTQSWLAPVRAGLTTRADLGIPGILVGGQRLAVPPGLQVRTWLEPGGKRLRGHRYRDERWYDKAPLTTLDELRWKVRAIVVHRARWQTFKDGWRNMHRPRKRGGRQFLIDSTGVVHQTLDLFDHTFAGGPSIDAATIAVEIGVPPGQPPTVAQLKATGLLLETLSGLLPRVVAPFPADADRTVPAIRSVRGLMTGRQAGYRRDAKFSLDLGRLSRAARGIAIKGALPKTSLPEGIRSGIAVLTDAPGATIDAKGPDGISRHGVAPWVSCEASGPWSVIATHPDRARVSRRAPTPIIDLTLPKLGSLKVVGPSAIEGTPITVAGPDGFSAATKLPWAADDLTVGTYRVSVAQEGRPPFRWAVRVDAKQTSELTLPDLSRKKLPSIYIDGATYPLPADVKVINHRSRKGLSFYRARRMNPRHAFYSTRKLGDGREVETLAEISQVTRSVVLHADVVKDSPATFRVLVARHLSTHFAIDWDGTLYQFLDPKHVAFGAAEVNPFAVQIDLNNRLPNLVSDPKATYVPQHHRDARAMVTEEFARPMSPRMMINRRDVKSFGYNAHQYRALFALLTVLSGVIEGIEPTIPRDEAGRVPMGHVNWAEDFSGVIAHWHLTPRRWDPGPGFDWSALDRALRGAPSVNVAQQP